MKKRNYQLSWIGLGVGAVALLAFGVAHRAGKARQESSDTREVEGRDALPAAEGDALSSPVVDDLPAPVRAEAFPRDEGMFPRDEAMAEIWGSEQPGSERAELVELPGDFAGELETRGDTYDGIEPEDLGAEWLARATEAPPTGSAGPHRGGALSAEEALAIATEERDPDEIDDDDLGRA